MTQSQNLQSFEGLKERVLAAAGELPAATRAQVLRARAVLLACGVAGALVVFFARGGLRLTARPPSLVALTSLGTALVAGAGMWLLFTRGRSMSGRPAALLVFAAVASSVGFVAWKYGVSALYGLTERWPDRPGFRCLGLGVSVGALPLFAALAAARRAFPLTPIGTGAAMGAGAGLGSTVLVDLWCPVGYLPHLLLGHLLPIALLAVAGGIAGRLVLRWPARPRRG